MCLRWVDARINAKATANSSNRWSMGAFVQCCRFCCSPFFYNPINVQIGEVGRTFVQRRYECQRAADASSNDRSLVVSFNALANLQQAYVAQSASASPAAASPSMQPPPPVPILASVDRSRRWSLIVGRFCYWFRNNCSRWCMSNRAFLVRLIWCRRKPHSKCAAVRICAHTCCFSQITLF